MTRRPRTLLAWLRHEARQVDRWCGRAIIPICFGMLPFVSNRPPR